MNKVVLLGRLTKDIEIRQTQGGMAIGRTSIAVDRRAKAGEQKEADFINLTFFGKTAEFVSKWLGKGRRILVDGRLKISKYKDKDGNDRDWTEVIVDNVEFADDKKKDVGNPDDPFSGGTPMDESDMPF